ncbi:putative rhomboid protease [Coniosporium apollinis]|uniref:rhomboid protease n=1 Tax=Coniosporium apollinis TaxID=61459 RepID=A0ABQ9NJX7_9PEZI|nr:putative rhomboid protease [Coniosporium apollinis]
MALSFLQFNPARIRSYVFRLPLCTRLLTTIIVAFYIASVALPWLPQWAALIPSQVGLKSMYRLNTYPFLHANFFHAFFNILAFVPLMERFESEFGTLISLALFTGPFGLIPGALYILTERVILRGDTAVQGTSVWVFLLLANEAMKTYRTNPHFIIGDVKIPTWTTPLFIILVVSFLVPNTSLVGHLCGAAVGYLWGLSWIRFLSPPEKILRWVESKLNLLGRLPHYVSVDQKTYGRYGVLPSNAPALSGQDGGPVAYTGSTQRLGP